MSTIAERLSAVDAKLNTILTNANTQLTDKGKTAISDLSDLPSAVSELKNPTGEIEITENGTVDVSNYASANVNVSGGTSEYNAKVGPTLTTSSSEFGTKLIDRCIQKLPASFAITGTGTDISNIFSEFYNLEEIPYIDYSNVTIMQSAFNQCRTVTSISLGNTGNLTDIFRCFDGCSNLVTIAQFDMSKVTNMRNAFRNCSSLSNDTLNTILYMIANASRYSSTKTLAYIGLTSAQATTCTGLSNWAAAQAAGWTTGY